MSPPLVLITGATGHVGFAVLVAALKAGYRVRAAVRSPAKASIILSNPVIQSLSLSASTLTFVTVPDLTIPGAYDSSVQDAEYIIHVASPIPSGQSTTQEDYQKNFIDPAVRGTTGLLDSAYKKKNTKRVVITSSVAAIIPFTTVLTDMAVSDTVNAESRIPDPPGPYASEFEAYTVSKAKAQNAAESWIAEHKPDFDVVFILPSGVMGRNDLILRSEDAVSGTNAWILGSVVGLSSGRMLPGSTVHNDDVARLHVEALQTDKIPSGSYIASSNNPRGTLEGTRLNEATALAVKLFPDAVRKGLFPNNGVQESALNRIDARKTEEVFGWPLQGFEEQVQSVVGHYIELVSKV